MAALLSTMPPDAAAVGGAPQMGGFPYPAMAMAPAEQAFYAPNPGVYASASMAPPPAMAQNAGASLPRLLGALRPQHEITEAAKGAQRAAAIIAACIPMDMAAGAQQVQGHVQGHKVAVPAQACAEAAMRAAPRVLQLDKALATSPMPAPTPLDSSTPQTTMLSMQTPMPSAAVGSPEMPTVGSALHGTGACKPCAFVFKEGCQNGSECKFCHLCEQGEKKKRKKERKEMMRAAKQWGC